MALLFRDLYISACCADRKFGAFCCHRFIFFFVLFFRFDNFDKKVVGELILKKSQ